ncbi:MAG: hypothetical protein AABX70_06715 [Nanoarchaeota archaeon]
MSPFEKTVEKYLDEIEAGVDEVKEAVEKFRKSSKDVKAAKELVRDLNMCLPRMSEAKQKLAYNCQ